MLHMLFYFFIIPVLSSDVKESSSIKYVLHEEIETEKIEGFYVPILIENNHNFSLLESAFEQLTVLVFGQKIIFKKQSETPTYGKFTMYIKYLDNISSTLVLKCSKISEDENDLTLNKNLEIEIINPLPSKLWFIEEFDLNNDSYSVYQHQQKIDARLMNIKSSIDIYTCRSSILSCWNFFNCCCKQHYQTTIYNYKICEESYNKYTKTIPTFAKRIIHS